MTDLISADRLLEKVEALARGEFFADPREIIRESIDYLKPPQKISTLDCAVERRFFPGKEGADKIRWSRDLTPYNVAPMNALDDPNVNEVVVVKPSRSGGTVIGENYLFKLMLFGPHVDVLWYLDSGDAVKAYVQRTINPMFDLHPELKKKLGLGRSDNNDTFKRVSGHPVEFLALNDSNTRNRDACFVCVDESDAAKSDYAASPLVEAYNRSKMFGNRRKVLLMSHPDLGWGSGVANAWQLSSRGIYIMQCPQCGGHASAHSTKFWPDVPQFKITYDKLSKDAPPDDRVELARATARLACPHGHGCVISEAERLRMTKSETYMHVGQSLDTDLGIIGDAKPNRRRGFYVHGSMLPFDLGELTFAEEAALIRVERTKKTDQLKKHYTKGLSEIFDGDASGIRSSAAILVERAKHDPRPFEKGFVPAAGKFVVGCVDLKKSRFDVSWYAWDLEGRSWWLDRSQIATCFDEHGVSRGINTYERVGDFEVLIDQVINRRFVIQGNEDFALPVALTTIDASDGNVQWNVREFMRRCFKRGMSWQTGKYEWSKVRALRAITTKGAPEIPDKPTDINVDEKGRHMDIPVLEYRIGQHKLKLAARERLAVADHGPGHCYFAQGIEPEFYDEFYSETYDGKNWIEDGPNESFDLFCHADAARRILKPESGAIDWSGKNLPVWATPISLIEAPKVQAPKISKWELRQQMMGT